MWNIDTITYHDVRCINNAVSTQTISIYVSGPFFAVFSAASLSGCQPEDNFDTSQKQNIVDLYLADVTRLVGEVYTHALIEEKREACVNPDIPNVDINKFKPRIMKLKFRLTEHSVRDRGWLAGSKNKLETPYLEDANTIVFWDSDSREIGYYNTSGGDAFHTSLHVCIVSKSTPDMARFIFSASPPNAIQGSGNYDPKWETYRYFDDWLQWKLSGKSEPTINERIKVREWRLCDWEGSTENNQYQLREMPSACITKLRAQYLGENSLTY